MRLTITIASALMCGILTFLIATVAVAQTPPPDIIRLPIVESGKYQMIVVIPTQDANDVAVFEACCDRVDVDPVIPLGCSPRDGTEQIISFQVDVIKTPGNDARVQCYTVNPETQSDYSINAYKCPFPLKPNQPSLQ